MFAVYIIYSAKLDGYYIGYTSEPVEERLRKHLSAKNGHTSKAKDWKVVFVEYFETKSETIAREKQLKNWKSKVRIKELINKKISWIEHPDF